MVCCVRDCQYLARCHSSGKNNLPGSPFKKERKEKGPPRNRGTVSLGETWRKNRKSGQTALSDRFSGIDKRLACVRIRSGHQGCQVPNDVLAHASYQIASFLGDGDHDFTAVFGCAHAFQVAHFL